MQIWSAEIKEVENLYNSIKGLFPDIDKELEPLIKTEDANVILLYSRRCLEVIVSDLCESELNRPRKTEPLQGIIDKLNRENKVPANIVISMTGLNGLSNFGTHPKDFDPEQVKPVLNNLTTVIKWYLKKKEVRSAVEEVKIGEEKIQQKEQLITDKKIKEKSAISAKTKILPAVAMIILFLIVAILVYPKIFKRDTLEKLRTSGARISIAVMPFQNLTNDTTWNIWQDGIQVNLTTSLSSSEELKVRQSETINSLLESKGTFNYASITPSMASMLSRKLDVEIFLYGSISQSGNKMRLNAQLINSKTEEVIKPFIIEGPSTKDTIFYLIDSLSEQITNFLKVTKMQDEVIPDFKQLAPDFKQFSSTKSSDAFINFIYGNKVFMKGDFSSATKYFSQAVALDSNFYFALYELSLTYSYQSMWDQAKKMCLELYEKRDQMPLLLKIYTDQLYAYYFETPHEQLKYLLQIEGFDDQLPTVYMQIGIVYSRLFQFDKAIPEYEKALEIYKKWDSKPLGVIYYTFLGEAYHKNGLYRKEKEIYEKGVKDFPKEFDLPVRQAILALTLKDTVEANRYIARCNSLMKDLSFSDAAIMTRIANIYYEADILDRAEELYQKALSADSENPARLNNLAYFLIDKDQDVKKGLELVDKALKLRPDNFVSLQIKGWGLYKQGKFKEAFNLLQTSWDLRKKYSVYYHEAYLHLQEAKKAVAALKNN